MGGAEENTFAKNWKGEGRRGGAGERNIERRGRRRRAGRMRQGKTLVRLEEM